MIVDMSTPVDLAPNPLTAQSPREAALRGWSRSIDPRVAVCLFLLGLLIVWAKIYPQTGDGDAIMHYINAREGLWDPDKLLGSWARMGSKLPLLIPAQFGVFAARCA